MGTRRTVSGASYISSVLAIRSSTSSVLVPATEIRCVRRSGAGARRARQRHVVVVERLLDDDVQLSMLRAVNNVVCHVLIVVERHRQGLAWWRGIDLATCAAAAGLNGRLGGTSRLSRP